VCDGLQLRTAQVGEQGKAGQLIAERGLRERGRISDGGDPRPRRAGARRALA
jgi:hypothetical protein